MAPPFRHASSGSGRNRCWGKFGHTRELRIQHGGDPYRVFYAFDPRRSAILLIGGSKVGDDRFYERMVPVVDRIYEEHLARLANQGGSERK
ncbi:MAG: type II toxin-antitoxin system RelE/ParE family toxin [Polyangiaceae bacterium]|nr:type II toxin-antitoxin system RelE/ParE family toxin [Polyangiaceae bacterium]